MYRFGSDIQLDSVYEDGGEWVAFLARLSDGGQNIIVKRYVTDNMSERKVCVMLSHTCLLYHQPELGLE